MPILIPSLPCPPPYLPPSFPDKYFTSHLSLSLADATKLHTSYYLTYGLAIEGLVRHHHIDPLAYNEQVDDALPLETVLHPDPALNKLLADVDRSKVKLWLFTNAYVNHARRVIRLLGIGSGEVVPGKANGDAGSESDGDGLGPFEGLTYCDYGAATATDPTTGEMQGFVCKPQRGMFEKAMREAGVEDPTACYFVGMSCLFLSCICFFLACVVRLSGLERATLCTPKTVQSSGSSTTSPHPHPLALPFQTCLVLLSLFSLLLFPPPTGDFSDSRFRRLTP